MESSNFQHIVTRYQTAMRDNVRNHASYYSERNFIGNRRTITNGVASGGAIQFRRLGGPVASSTVVSK